MFYSLWSFTKCASLGLTETHNTLNNAKTEAFICFILMEEALHIYNNKEIY